MPAASVAPKSRAGFAARLSAKVGPLPVWGWAAAILAAYFLYSRMRPPAATTTADVASASTPDGTTGAAQTPASGQGSSVDNLSQPLIEALGANAASIDALTTQVLTASTSLDSGGAAASSAGSTSALATAAQNEAQLHPAWYEAARQTPGNPFYGLPSYA